MIWVKMLATPRCVRDNSHMYTKFIFIFGLFSALNLHAYPEFIGLGYTGCMTCHFNGAGNGGLNDYGRGLFAAEIASKILWNSKKTDDALSATSGMFGSAQLPYWFRPSLKYRGLNVERNPGSKDQKVSKFYQMQEDFNIHMPFNEEQTFIFAMNLGAVTEESAASPSKTFSGTLLMSREYYIRGQMNDNLWFYVGLLDKVFGIRHADHTAVNRSFLGLGQNHQVHSLIVHYAKEQHELFINPFIGNLNLEKDKQFPGVSLHYEYEPAERWRMGVSYMRDRDTASLEKNTLGFLLKRGISGGHSLLAETGFKNYVGTDNKAMTSVYAWTQATMRIVRGVFFQSVMEYLKADTSKLASENMRFGAGFLLFPMQRMEFRFGGVSGRSIDPTQISKDTWAMQSQLHLSF